MKPSIMHSDGYYPENCQFAKYNRYNFDCLFSEETNDINKHLVLNIIILIMIYSQLHAFCIDISK